MLNLRVAISLLLLLLALAACGPENSSSELISNDSETPRTAEGENSLFVANDNIYEIDDFTAVGYKAITQFELDTLPSANDAWYGFYSQKDVELRFYESHPAALEHGVELAEAAVNKGAVGYSKQPPRRWDAYAVVGNVVMLCELEIESCKALIAELPE
ncbi:DUF6810 family protein [Candidatus Lucifugimonas marina]|uniref:DUF6810 domain-containing protein n=1 Tax=Candidatus Lucifugimonas marina TaxID=3038979 RepID=A0AAJ6CS30_9CHLR|nr:hypothetical protein [SAR202 cluster bacterium JH702]WFG34990.1 hypothetical protein GKN94_04570 [SAR202 cluster bacterium JH545]WFG38948.1 hypothetical protein GKO48_04735 [SAR202 cluster bacterium JH1073]